MALGQGFSKLNSRVANQGDFVLAIGPSAGGVADVFSGSLDALRRTGRRVVSGRLRESGSAAVAALRGLLRYRRELGSANWVYVEFGSNDLAVFWFALLVTAARPDVVVVVHDPPAIAHAPGAGLIARTGKWRMRLAHRVLSPLLDRAATGFLVRHAGAVVVLGAPAGMQLEERTSRPVIVAPHGGRSRTAGEMPPSTCEYVLFAGYLGPNKGLEVLINAWSSIEDPALRLVIVGGVGDGHAGWLDELRSRSALFPCPPEWIGHVESEDEFQGWFERAAIVVLPYERSSPASGILVRAMFAGRCVVATRVQAVLDVVEDEVSGILINVGDADTMAARIVELAANGEKRDRLGAGARLRAADRFGWSGFVDAVDEAYAAAVSTPMDRRRSRGSG